MSKPSGSWLRQLGREAIRATTLGWELALPIFGGVLLGYFLDRQMGTDYTFTLGLMMLGVFAGFYNIWRFGQGVETQQRRLKARRKREQEEQQE